MTKPKIKNILLNMRLSHANKLDKLCKVNARSRREVVEILVDRALAELQDDPDLRLNPN